MPGRFRVVTSGRLCGVQRSAATRASVVLFWLFAIVTTAALVVVRFNGAMAQRPYDFYQYFYPAGRLLLEGLSPFNEPGYVYSPLIALAAAAVVGMSDPVVGWTALSLTAGVLAVGLFVWSVWPMLRPWQRPLVATIAIVTLYYNWQTTLMMSLGQVEAYVLLAMTAAGLGVARSWPTVVGVSLAIAALLKTWPVISALWLLRKHASHRLRTFLFAAGTIVAGVAATTLSIGPGAVAQWVDNVLAARTQSQLVHFNAWDIGRQVFGGTNGGSALLYSPLAASVVTIVAVAITATLLVICLRYPGSSMLSMWHVLLLCILLLPVSHNFYLIQALPILWIRVVRMAATRKTRTACLLAVWVAWWIVVCRIQWPGDMTVTVSSAGYAAMMAATYVALAFSVLDEALQHRGRAVQPSI